jgi:Tol biopolymer transport system component
LKALLSTAGLALAIIGGQPDPATLVFGTPRNLGAIINGGAAAGGTGFDGGPSPSRDGLTLYFASDRPGGSGGPDLWVATRKAINGSWENPVNLGPTINGPEQDASPSLSPDGHELYVVSTTPRPGGQGDSDLWVTRRATVSAPWRPPENLGPVVNSPQGDGTPQLSRDGHALYFASWRPGGFGKRDIWVATRPSPNEPWRPAVNLGSALNGPDNEWSPAPWPEGLALVFQSDRPGGLGGDDLYLTTRQTPSSPWNAPANLRPLNSAAEDAKAHFSADGSTLYFMSTRPGGQGFFDIWEAPVMKSMPPD